MMNVCPMCGGDLRRTQLEAYPYTESGLPNVVLEGVVEISCACGESNGVEIPSMDSLHRALALHLLRSEARLSGPEIRFLRTWLGWSGRTFADKLRVTPETVSRWEHGTKEMNLSNERLLRLYVAQGQPDHHYCVEDTERLDPRRASVHPPLRLRVTSTATTWTPA